MKYMITGVLILFTSGVFAQSTIQNRKRIVNMEEHEGSSMPYLPNGYNNQRVTLPFKNNINYSATGTTIRTSQVNVNAAGNNIVGDAANEPSIAINLQNPNQIVIGWRQFDNVGSNFRQAGWNYTFDRGLTWGTADKIEPGIFRSDPVLDFDNAGNFFYNSLTNSPDFMCKVFKSTDGGISWNSGIDACGGDKQWMAVDNTNGPGAGNIYAVWNPNASFYDPFSFVRSEDSGDSFNSCTQVGVMQGWSNIAVSNSGEVFVFAFAGNYGDTIAIFRSANAQNNGSQISWSIPTILALDGQYSFTVINNTGLPGQPTMNFDRSGQTNNVYLLFPLSQFDSTFADPGDVFFYKSQDGGFTWGQPIRINDDTSRANTQWFPTMSVAPNGRIDVIWLDNRKGSGTDSSALYYSYSNDNGGSWSVNEQLSPSFDPHVGYPMQDKMGDYYDMDSDNSGAYLAWAATFNGEEDVYQSYIQPAVATAIGSPDSFSLSVFPNPFKDVIHLVSSREQLRVEVYSVLGKKVYSHSAVQDELNLESLEKGIYFLDVISDSGYKTVKKIVKN